MGILAIQADERVKSVSSKKDTLSVDLMDGRTITVPLIWYQRLFHATPQQRSHWEICGGGYGIHWPDLDEDLSTEGLLKGIPAPGGGKGKEKAGTKKPSKEVISPQKLP